MYLSFCLGRESNNRNCNECQRDEVALKKVYYRGRSGEGVSGHYLFTTKESISRVHARLHDDLV